MKQRTPRIIRAGLFLFMVLFGLNCLWLASVTDDAYISFRYARNLARLGVLAWNPGDPPVEGYTNFLWVLIHAGVWRLGWSLPRFAQILGVAAGLACVLLTWRIGRRGLRLRPAEALVPCLLLAVAGPLAKWSAGGLETSFFTMLALAGCERAIAWSRGGRAGTLRWAALILLLATLTRPEGLIVFGLLAAVALPLGIARPRRHGLAVVSATALYLAAFLAYFAWRYHYFGYLLPNTYYAKTGGTIFQWLRGLEYCGWYIALFGLPLLPALAAGWLRAGELQSPNPTLPWLRRRFGLILVLAVAVTYSAYIVYVGGDYMAMFRFHAPVTPFYYLLFGAVVAAGMRGGLSRPWRLAWGALLLLAAAGTVLQSTPLEKRLFPSPERHHGTWRGVAGERWGMRRLIRLASFFEGLRRTPAESISTDTIGAISYFSNLVVLDNQGLTDPHIAHQKPAGMGQGYAGHEKTDYVYVLSRKPTFYMSDRFLHPYPPSAPYLTPEVAAILQRDYRFVTTWLDDPENHESGYFGYFVLKTR